MSTIRANTLVGVDGVSAVTLARQVASKAWLTYDCSATTIRGSFNISSVTRNGSGDFSLTMSVAMIDIYYSTVGSCNRPAGTGDGILSIYANNNNGALVDPTTTVARITTSRYDNADTDFTFNCVTITR